MIVSLSKFKKGESVYCHIGDITFLTKINDLYLIGFDWYYVVDRLSFDGKDGLLECEEYVLSKNIDDKKVKIGKLNEQNNK